MEKKPICALLLLPSPPSSLNAPNIKAAYGPAVEDTLRHMAQAGHSTSRLDMAMQVPPQWPESYELSRTALFDWAQKSLAQTYSLICAEAAKLHIQLDCPGGVDVRAFYVTSTQGQASPLNTRDDRKSPYSGPVVDLTTLVASRPAFEVLYAVESETGEGLLKSFLLLCESKRRRDPICRRVRGGLSITDPSDVSKYAATSHTGHTSIAVGGTFDHLHLGHKLLLTATALLAEPRGGAQNPSQTVVLTIGISGDDLLTNKKFAEEMESWDERQRRVADFLESIIVFPAAPESAPEVEKASESGPNGKYVRVSFNSGIIINYVQISDPFGPTITDETISALVLSQETRSGGKAVNEKRQEKGWAPLEVFEIDVLENGAGDNQLKSTPLTTAFESKVSSTDIRRRIREKRNSG